MHIVKLLGTKCYLAPMNPDYAEQFTVWLNELEVTDLLPDECYATYARRA